MKNMTTSKAENTHWKDCQVLDIDAKTSDQIIRRHMCFSMATGIIPFPLIDLVAVTAIQLEMLRDLAGLYGVDFNKELSKSLAGALIGSTVPIYGSRVILGSSHLMMSALKGLPGIGLLVGMGAQTVLAGASTYAVGRIFDHHFSTKGTFEDFNIKERKEKYIEYFNIGKKIVAHHQSSHS